MWKGEPSASWVNPRVNVLLVNLALDRQFGKATPLPPAPEKKETKDATKEGSTPAQVTTQTAPANEK